MKGMEKSETDLNWVHRYLKEGDYPPGLTATEKRMVRKRAERFCFLDDQLIFIGTVKAKEHGAPARKVLLTRAERQQVVETAHIDKDGSHNGLERTVDTVSAKYYWVGIYKCVKDYIRGCGNCRATRPRLGCSRGAAQADDVISIIAGDYECETTSPDADAPSLVVEESERESKCFWDMVDLRLFGPYRVGAVYKYILVVLDAFTLWPEAFVLDNVSQTSIVHVLLKLISRYGQMSALIMSMDNEILEAGIKDALQIIQQAVSFKIVLQRRYLKATDDHYSDLEETLKKFVKKYPKSWSDCLDLWLLPLRTSLRELTETAIPAVAQPRDVAVPMGIGYPRASTPQKKDVDTGKVVELLMRANVIDASPEISDIPAATEPPDKDTPLFVAPTPNPVENTPLSTTRGIVTRSRTGNSRPKDLDSENVYSTHKRRASTATDTPTGKQAKAEPATTSEPDDSLSDDESDVPILGETSKLTVGLDEYYMAIVRYINGKGYMSHWSSSFKRLIRDVCKNYVMDGDILHQVAKGSSPMKRVIMTSPERHKLLQVAHGSDVDDEHLPKSSMLAKLRNVHWKGKCMDCQAFVLACSFCDNGERRLKDVPPPLERKLLTRDTLDTYKEIRNYIKYEAFSSDKIARKLEDVMKLIRKFRVVDDNLFHVVANRRLAVLTTAADRLEAVKLSHLLKGTHADERGTLKQLSENYYWFGMITDVRVYINLCCANSNTYSLVDRYFKFRELNLNIPLAVVPVNLPYTPIRRIRIKIERPLENVNEITAKVAEEMAASTPMEEPDSDCVQENTKSQPGSTDNAQTKEVAETSGDDFQPSGIFVTTVSDTEEDISIGDVAVVNSDGPDVENDETADVLSIGIVTDTSNVITEPPKQTSEQENVSAKVPEVVTIKVSETGDFTLSKHDVVITGTRAKALAATHRLFSDPVTMAAVKSILPEDCIMSTEIALHVNKDTAKAEKANTGKAKAKTKALPSQGLVTKVGDTSINKCTDATPDSSVELVEGTADSTSLSESQVLLDGVEDKKNVMAGVGADTDSDDSEQLDTDDYEEEEEEEEEEEQGLYAKIEVTPDGVPRLVTKAPLQGAQLLKLRNPLQTTAALTGDEVSTPVPPTPRPHYRCTVCSKLFYGEIKFKIHMYKHTGQKPFHCNRCDKKYTNNKSLALHIKVHTGDLHFLCSVCGKATVSKTALKSHLKSHLSPGGGFPVKCDICDREFRRRHLMERHKLFKHIKAQTEFACTACTKVFGHQRSLKRHYMSHHVGVRNHKCEICDKGFYRKEYLTSHMLQHANNECYHKVQAAPLVYKQAIALYTGKQQEGEGEDVTMADDVDNNNTDNVKHVQRNTIILHDDGDGGMRVADLKTAREVKRLLDNSVIRPEIGETMVVQIEQPSGGECRVVRVDNGAIAQMETGSIIQTEEQVVEIPVEGGETYMEYQEVDGQSTEYVTVLPSTAGAATSEEYSYGYVEAGTQGSQELMYGQPAVQYEVECVGEVDHEEALSAINLLAQASAAHYETVVSQI